MSARTALLVLLSIFLIAAASAAIPDRVEVGSNPRWVVAGSSATATLSVKVLNGTDPVQGAQVWATSQNITMGTILETSSGTTDTGGMAYFTFRPNRTSGEAPVEIRVSYTENNVTHVFTHTYYQKIDHNVPKYYDRVISPANATVATDATIVVRLKDVYGNPIDSRREADEGGNSETVTFSDSPDSDGSLWINMYTPGVHTLGVNVDLYGNATVQYRLPTKAGDNLIKITAPAGVISGQTNANVWWLTIRGTPSTPDRMTSYIRTPPYDVDPAPPNLAVANGRDIFQIYYTVYDVYGNPIPDISITWTFLSETGRTETKNLITNYQGIVYIEVGPSTQLQKISLTASLKPVYNSIDDVKDEVRFVSGGPAIFELFASPVLLASREANNESSAYVRAHLMDNMGRGIPGETVTFSIITENGTPVEPVSLSSFSRTSSVRSTAAITDLDGFATVLFYPGMFPNESSGNFSANATATAIVKAYWSNASLNISDEDTVFITYKNYPYIRAEIFVSPKNVEVNQTLNVTILLTGDGYAPHLPIDVILCNSRAQSMLNDMYYMGETGAAQDKMVYAHLVMDSFTYKFRSNRDRIGIVTFGDNRTTYLTQNNQFKKPGDDNDDNDDWYIPLRYGAHPKDYTDFVTIDLSLNDSDAGNMNRVRENIKKITPSKDPDWLPQGQYLSPMRYGIFRAIRELNQSQDSGDRVKAVIVLTDRSWSQTGDPLARDPDKGRTLVEKPITDKQWNPGEKSEFTVFGELGDKYSPLQNMSKYAIASKVRIYVVAYMEKGTSMNTDDVTTFNILSNSTGGRYFSARSVSELENIYYIIAEELKRYAGAETTMGLDFTNVQLMYDNTTFTYPGSQIFEYEFEQNVSTHITSWNKTANPITDKLRVPPYPSNAIPGPVNGNITYPYSLDQRAQWASNNLSFHVGNISIGQSWQAKFRLKAMKPGAIYLFGDSSSICFASFTGKDCISLPETIITSVLNQTNATRDQVELDIIDGSLIATKGNSSEFLDLAWVLNYTGKNTVRQDLYYQFSRDGISWDGNWIKFDQNLTGGAPIDHANYSSRMDIRNRVGYMKFKVFSYEIPLGGAWDEEVLPDAIPVGFERGASIKLE